MPYWNFEYTKDACNSTVENVGGGIGQDPATEVTHLELNQPPVSFPVIYAVTTHSIHSCIIMILALSR